MKKTDVAAAEPNRRVSFRLRFDTPLRSGQFWQDQVGRRTRVAFRPGFAEAPDSVAGQTRHGVVVAAEPDAASNSVLFTVDLDELKETAK